MSVKHSIPLTTFPKNSMAPDQFQMEIEQAQQNGLIGKVLVGVPISGFDAVDIFFSEQLDTNEQDALNDLAQNHTADGIPGDEIVKVSPTYEDTGMDTVFKGYMFEPSAKGLAADPVYSMLDIAIESELLLRGGWYELASEGAVKGDMLEFSVIDKDDVLGLFASYGLTAGQDVIELSKFVKTECINPDPNVVGLRNDFRTRGGSKLAGGLYMRVSYISTGTTVPIVKINIEYQE